jgi:hypothetical protein
MKYEMKIKFICIDNKNIEDKVTIGKIYEGYYNQFFIKIINDLNIEYNVLSKRLISLKQYRKDKIHNILNIIK